MKKLLSFMQLESNVDSDFPQTFYSLKLSFTQLL